MAQVFISYQRRDRALVERVRDGLAAAGLTVWWDDDVTPREQWDRILEREIEAADHVLVLWTENSIDSKWVRTEVAWASEHKPGTLVQARFDDTRIPMIGYLTQYVDLDRDEPRASPGWPKLLEWLGRPQPKPKPIKPAPRPRAPFPALSPLFYLTATLLMLWGALALGASTASSPYGGANAVAITFIEGAVAISAGLSLLLRKSFADKLVYIWAAASTGRWLNELAGGFTSLGGGGVVLGFSLLLAAVLVAYAARRQSWLRT